MYQPSLVIDPVIGERCGACALVRRRDDYGGTLDGCYTYVSNPTDH
jgi:hypothetical protein